MLILTELLLFFGGQGEEGHTAKHAELPPRPEIKPVPPAVKPLDHQGSPQFLKMHKAIMMRVVWYHWGRNKQPWETE